MSADPRLGSWKSTERNLSCHTSQLIPGAEDLASLNSKSLRVSGADRQGRRLIVFKVRSKSIKRGSRIVDGESDPTAK